MIDGYDNALQTNLSFPKLEKIRWICAITKAKISRPLLKKYFINQILMGTPYDFTTFFGYCC